MICFVDLPNLTFIESQGSSFFGLRIANLESITLCENRLFLDIPNVENVNLSDSFSRILSFSLISI